jgi:hypothetical protein
MYLLTTEATDDGMWFEEPAGYDSEQQARDAVLKLPQPPKGHCHVLYRCDAIATFNENP